MPDDVHHSPSLSQGVPSSITGAEPGLGTAPALRKRRDSPPILAVRRFLHWTQKGNQAKYLRLLEHEEVAIRASAAHELRLAGNHEAVPHLLSLVENDPSVQVRARAMNSLIYIAERFGAEVVVPQAEPVLLAVVQDEGLVDAVRMKALWALADLGIDRALPIAQELFQHPNPTMRRVALGSLARLNKRRAVDAALVAFDDPDPEVRWAAALISGSLGDDRLLPGLAKCINDPYTEKIEGNTIRSNAIGSLMKLRTPRNKYLIRDLLRK